MSFFKFYYLYQQGASTSDTAYIIIRGIGLWYFCKWSQSRPFFALLFDELSIWRAMAWLVIIWRHVIWRAMAIYAAMVSFLDVFRQPFGYSWWLQVVVVYLFTLDYVLSWHVKIKVL